jgi:endonuclease
MPGSIYDKPTRGLFKEMLADWGVKPGQVFTTERVLQWFQDRYPKLRPGTIKAHLVVFSTNDKSRLHHTLQAGDDLLFKVATNQFRLYESGKDPAPVHEMVEGDVSRQGASDEQEIDELVDAQMAGSTQFALEQDLQRYLADNLRVIEPGLTLYQDEGLKGLEYPAGGGRRIDILALDKAGGFVVLELKVEKGYDRVVGQLLRYMNWVRKELAEPGQRVRGIIVCRAMSEDLRLACASIKDVELFEYQLSVTVTKVPALELPS